MATEWPRTVTTHRELTLPPEIVALICAFKPEESHIGQRFSLTRWERHSLQTMGIPIASWSYYACCGGSNYTHRPRLANGRPGMAVTPPCRRFEKGMYHPGKLEKGQNVDHQYVRWTCCGATFDKHDLDAPVGCTPLDLTLRVTTVTRAARPVPTNRPTLPPPTIPYSRENVLFALEGLYAMGGEMRELACMYGTRLRWTPPHLRADDPGQTL